MPGYRFTIDGNQAREPIEVSLPDDNSAWDWAKTNAASAAPWQREMWGLDDEYRRRQPRRG